MKNGGNSLIEALICGRAQTAFGLWRSNPASASVDAVPSVPPLLDSHYDIDRIKKSKHVVVLNIEFNVYDQTTLSGDAAIEKIYESLSLDNDAYVQSRFTGAQMSDWQPNWLQPQFLVNGTDLFRGIDRGNDGTGFPIPFKWEPWRPLQTVSSLEVRAHSYQRVTLDDSNVKYVPYSVYCFAEFILFD